MFNKRLVQPPINVTIPQPHGKINTSGTILGVMFIAILQKRQINTWGKVQSVSARFFFLSVRHGFSFLIS